MNNYSALNAFPTGALRINRTGAFSGIPMLLITLVLLLCSVGVLVLGVPGIIKDWRISQDPASVNAKVDGGCDTYFVMTDCDVTITYRDKGVLIDESRHYFFFSFGGADYHVQALSRDGDRSQVTLDLGIDKLYNRIVFLMVGCGFFLAGVWSTLVNFRRTRPLAQFGKGKTVQVRPVVVSLPQKSNTNSVTYQWVSGGQKRLFLTKFSKAENGPFILGVPDAKRFDALAVVPQGSDTAILLDDALTRVELTEEQRQALYQSREG